MLTTLDSEQTHGSMIPRLWGRVEQSISGQACGSRGRSWVAFEGFGVGRVGRLNTDLAMGLSCINFL